MTYVITLDSGIGNIIQAAPFMHHLKRLGFKVIARHHQDAHSEEACRLLAPAYDEIIGPDGLVPDAIDKGSIFKSSFCREMDSMPEWAAWFQWHDMDVPSPKSLCTETAFTENVPTYDVVLAPACKPNWPMKKWPWWQQLIHEYPGCAVVGLENDGGVLDGYFDDLRGQMDLFQVAGIFRKAGRVICEEGGMGHLSCAQGTRTYILFGGTSPVKNMPPKNAVKITTDEELPCMPCQFRNCHIVGNGGSREYHGCKDGEKVDGWTRCMHSLAPSRVVANVGPIAPEEKSIVICTAVFGDRGILREPFVVGGARYVCFSDKPLKSNTWEVIVEKKKSRSVMLAKEHKMMMHRLFPRAEYLIWVDSTCQLINDMGSFEIERALGDNDVAMYSHVGRKCVYEEADACIERGDGSPETIHRQVGAYRRVGLPDNFGLHNTGFIIRRNRPSANCLFEEWWREVQTGSRRDQISFDFCRWRTGAKVTNLLGSIWLNNYFRYRPHHPLVRRYKTKKEKVVLYDKHGDHIRPWLPGLVQYLRDRFEVEIWAGDFFHRYKTINDARRGCRNKPFVRLRDFWLSKVEGARHVFMWNGYGIACDTMKTACDDSGVARSVVEAAWFPQSASWFIDERGINAASSIMDDDLSWVGRKQIEKLKRLKRRYIKNKRWYGPGQYVLVPLQLDNDTNIMLHSPFESMQDFIGHCEKRFKKDRLVFKAHPLAGDQFSGMGNSELVRNGNFLVIAQYASRVYGINSTCLLESAMMGVPTTAIGDGYLKRHSKHPQKLLAALADKQIPVGEWDLDYWIRPALERPACQPLAYQEVPANGKIDFVVVAYGIDDETIHRFVSCNGEIFERHHCNVLLVTDRPLSKHPDWMSVLVYDKPVSVISLPALVNYGVRRSDAEIVVKTDVDIRFTDEPLSHLSGVRRGHAVVGLCVYLKESLIPVMDWHLLKVKDRHFGAMLAMHRSDWYKLGGYNENIRGWGADDEDMVARIQKAMSVFIGDVGPLYHANHQDRKGTALWPNRWPTNMCKFNAIRVDNHRPIYDGFLLSKDDAVWDVKADEVLK